MNKLEGKKKIQEVVERYSKVSEQAKKKLSEQDITTKFVLPMLEALNWNTYKVSKEGAEVHEKAYRQKTNVGKGLPDITLRSDNGTVFVEVKKPPLGSKDIANLDRYEDADLIVLTSFEDLKVYTRYGKENPCLRQELNYKEYTEKFHLLWKILSNTREGKNSRTAYKATRSKCLIGINAHAAGRPKSFLFHCPPKAKTLVPINDSESMPAFTANQDSTMFV